MSVCLSVCPLFRPVHATFAPTIFTKLYVQHLVLGIIKKIGKSIIEIRIIDKNRKKSKISTNRKSYKN